MDNKQVQSKSILWQRKILNVVYPVLYVFGRLVGKTRQELEEAFVRWNNKLNNKQSYNLPCQKILLLTPHCLQKDACQYKITRHIENCHQCGGCRIGDLVALQKKYGCNLAVVTGGTLARQMVKEYKPQAIIAIACERDLASGIMDVFPLPVLGVLNERPFGPCFNTDVDMDKVEDAIKIFAGVQYA